jgi:hypothetical protein
VRKIQAHHIHAGSNQIADDSLGIRSRPERGHDFGAALGWGFVQADFRKRHETAPGLILVGSKGFSIGYEGCNGDAAASIVNGSGGNQLAGVFDSGAYRNYDAEWLFPHEKATLHTAAMSICGAKPL